MHFRSPERLARGMAVNASGFWLGASPVVFTRKGIARGVYAQVVVTGRADCDDRLQGERIQNDVLVIYLRELPGYSR
jgi:hypothetical protein